MNDAEAQKITDAMGRGPGLVVVSARHGEIETRVFGHPMMIGLRRTYPADAAAIASTEALAVAMVEGMPLLINFEAEESR